MATRTALIAGAGIGGLSAGVALQQAGWNVRIFERATSPRELGFGVALAPNAVAALRALGIGDVVLQRSFEPRRGEIRRLDGTLLKRLEMPPGILGGPMVVALRPALHGALLDAVGLDAVTLEADVVGFSEANGCATLHLAKGVAVDGDVLVGADGVGSCIRRVLHPSEPPPRPSGIVAVRGAVHGAVRHMRDCDGIYYLGRGVEAMLVRASETGIYWFLSLAQELIPADVRDPRAILSCMEAHLDPTLRAIAAETNDLRCDDLVDRDPISRWGTGVVTLLGDAAHPVLPHTGQGAAQAIVDGVSLGNVLGQATDVATALRVYERERQKKTAVLLAQGRRTARMMRTTNRAACAVRELVVRAIPVKVFMQFTVRINRRAGTQST